MIAKRNPRMTGLGIRTISKPRDQRNNFHTPLVFVELRIIVLDTINLTTCFSRGTCSQVSLWRFKSPNLLPVLSEVSFGSLSFSDITLLIDISFR